MTRPRENANVHSSHVFGPPRFAFWSAELSAASPLESEWAGKICERRVMMMQTFFVAAMLVSCAGSVPAHTGASPSQGGGAAAG